VARILNPSERLDWLRLTRSDSIGPITFYQLLGRFGSAAAALDALPGLARRAGRQKPLTIASRAAAEREMTALERIGARLVGWGEPDYPAALSAVEDSPPLIAVKGNAALLHRPTIAMVGARNASANGRRFARDLALQLGRHGLVVASGLARGIDAAAHEGALPLGTLAVLAGGVDQIYPEENRDLHEMIAERGVLLAETPVGTEPQARHFPRRNRIISGVSLGVVIVEAALRSGSLITARCALEQGREVFAVPGSPLDPRCRGTNDLIRNGATLVESADDVIGVLARHLDAKSVERRASPLADPPPTLPDQGEIDAARERVLALLSPTPVPVDELVRQSGMPPAVLMPVLLDLELAGRLERHPGNQVSLL
jgi:DNA processing protein